MKKESWYNLPALLEYDKAHGVNPTFFIGVRTKKVLRMERGFSYSIKKAREAIQLIKAYGFDVGVHGIAFDDYEAMKWEYETFKAISGLQNFGIRIHYLRLAPDTLNNLARIGYLFDSTVLSKDLSQQYKIGNMVEFPFHIMDAYLLGPEFNYTLEQAKLMTVDLLNKAEREGKGYVGILFHQRNLGKDFPHFRDWYLWLVEYCIRRGYEFVNYKDMIKEVVKK